MIIPSISAVSEDLHFCSSGRTSLLKTDGKLGKEVVEFGGSSGQMERTEILRKALM